MFMIKKVRKFVTNRNNRILASNIFMSVVIKGLAMIISVCSTPAYINYFGNQKVLGVWFTVIAIFNWIFNFDLGIGNGLRNKLSIAIAENNKDEECRLISSAYILLGIISMVVLISMLIIGKWVNWNKIMGIDTKVISQQVLQVTILIVFSGIIVQFWLKLIVSILYALEKTALPSLISLISSALILVFILSVRIENINCALITLAVVQVVVFNLPLIIVTIITFHKWLRGFKPSIKLFNMGYAKSITSLGLRFFIVQISLMLISSTNEFFITKYYASEYTVEYSIYFKWFNLALVLFSLISQPMWSAFSRAFAEGRYNWIKKIYYLFNWGAIMCSLICVGIAYKFQWIVDIWLKEESFLVDRKLSFIFAGITITMIFINVSTSVANACSMLKCQFLLTIVGAGIKIVGVTLLNSIYNEWRFVVLMNLLSLIPLCIGQTISTRKILYKLKYNNNHTEEEVE